MSSASTLNHSRVVFVISQPRAGSTLLQTILAGHPRVTAPGETWLMLPLIFAVGSNRSTSTAPYNGKLADEAIKYFAAENLDRGVSSIHREIGAAAQKIYDAVCERSGTDVIVDKTPRYYWIIDDLLRFMPDCRIILLVRNPLAVMSSIIATWASNSLGNLYRYRDDLLEAPSRIANAMQYADERIHTVHYEHLVREPEQVLGELQAFMNIEPVKGLCNYGQAPRRRFGDPVGIHDHDAPILDSIDKWLVQAEHSPVVWRLVNDYRKVLGKQVLRKLGYCDDQLRESLLRIKPSGVAVAPSLETQLRDKPMEPMRSVIRLRNTCAMAVSNLTHKAA
jgi:hypothetical protein